MSLKDDLKVLIDQLDDFTLTSMTRENPNVDPNSACVGQKLIDNCLDIFWPEFMHAPIKRALNMLGAMLTNDRKVYLHALFLDELIRCDRTDIELEAIGKFDDASVALTIAPTYIMTKDLRNNFIEITSGMINSAKRSAVFSEVAKSFYKNEEGISLTALGQCYQDIIICEERLEAAKEALDKKIAEFTRAENIPTFVLQDQFIKFVSDALNKGSSWNTTSLLPVTTSRTEGIFGAGGILTTNAMHLINTACEIVLNSPDNDGLVQSTIIHCLRMSPAKILSSGYTAYDLLADIFFSLIPGHAYQVQFEGSDTVSHLVHVATRDRLIENINEVFQKHRELTQASLENSQRGWAYMGIIISIEDIVHAIYGANTIAERVLPNIIINEIKHRDVFNLDPKWLSDFFMKFTPCTDVWCTDQDIIRTGQEMLERGGNAGEYVLEDDCSECSECEPKVLKWGHPYAKLVLTKDTGGKTLQPEDFILHVSTDKPGNAESYKNFRSIGFNIKNFAEIVGDLYVANNCNLNASLQCIMAYCYPIMKSNTIGKHESIFTTTDMLSTMPECKDNMSTAAFVRAVCYRVPFVAMSHWARNTSFDEGIERERQFTLSKINLCNDVRKIYTAAERCILQEANVKLEELSIGPHEVTIFAEELYKACFQPPIPVLPHEAQFLTERERLCFIETIRTLLKVYGLRQAMTPMEQKLAIANVIVQLIPIDVNYCLE